MPHSSSASSSSRQPMGETNQPSDRMVVSPALRNPDQYLGVIDIGSNSVRLVVYSGLVRVPDTVFNEKILCGLGSEIGSTGRLGDEAMTAALSTLRRFRVLCDHMGVKQLVAIATAAVRDAKNGPEFVAKVRDICGIDIDVIEGTREAMLAGLGVLSGAPDASGVAADLGGGSLELARLRHGRVHERSSLDIGPLRMMARFGDDMDAIKAHVREQLTSVDWIGDRDHQAVYMVGGAWRNIGKILMQERAIALPILHHYSLPRSEMSGYAKRLSRLRPSEVPFGDMIASRRLQLVPLAALVLRETLKAIRPKEAVFSSYGVREGYLFEQLDLEGQAEDPFLFRCQQMALERSRFAEHASDLYRWTRPLFEVARDSLDDRERLHKAVCLLSDVAWRGHPDFRAEKAVETVLHGHFVGIGHRERVFVAVALNQAYGAPMQTPSLQPVLSLLQMSEILEARLLGSTLRLAQRLSGGAASALFLSKLEVDKTTITLHVDESAREIANPVVGRRLSQLGQLMGRSTQLTIG